jgi:2-oxoglutarate dehydrogenase E2 component (dihydrolipoamide succinyltransferase)
MLASVTASPHVTAVFEADLSAVVAHRERHRADYQARGVPLSFTSYFIAACVPAYRAVPEVNSRFHADALEIFEDLDMGVGTALGAQGLVVPVLRGVQHLDLFGIAQQLAQLLEKARGGTLTAAETRGGTLTLSNHGVSGSLIATPILHQPQVAILGIGKIERRPKVKVLDGREQLAIATQCFVSLTIDHRALDGYQANAFLTAWVKALETWPSDP